MNKLVLILLFLLPNHLLAQVFYSPNQKMVEEAVDGGLFVISQAYQLKDSVTGEYFGRGGQNEFGRKYSLGVKVEHGYCFLDQTARPWEYDGNFNRYRSTYVPVIYKTQFKELTDTIMKEVPSYYQNQSIELLSKKVYLKIDSIPFKGDGFQIDTTVGKKTGWIVWLIAHKPLHEIYTKDSISYLIYRKELEIKDEIQEYGVELPSLDEGVQGGIFIEPLQTAIGQLTFRLIGFVVANEGKWCIVTPFLKMQSILNPIVPTEEIIVDELTPVRIDENAMNEGSKKNKRKNKNTKNKE